MIFPNPFDCIIDLLFPEFCPGCLINPKPNNNLFCVSCTLRIPYSKTIQTLRDNFLANKFSPRFDIQFAVGLYVMDVDSLIENLVRELKYQNRAGLGVETGVRLGSLILDSHLSEEIDILIPVPLHKKKELSRGYNQSEQICHGLSTVLNIPVDTHSLQRIKHTKTQTTMTKLKRASNIKDAFQLNKSHSLTGKHVCIVDDVVTTGATISECMQTLSQVVGVRFSVACLALPLE